MHSEDLIRPAKYGRKDVLQKQSPVPAAPGVYLWWFNQIPGGIDTTECIRNGSLALLYAGISPSAPPQNGKPPSRQNLRTRIRTHYAGNAEGSTLRKTLGCLLADELDIELRRVGSGGRRTFVAGESVLSSWMEEHAFVSWLERPEPWLAEADLIRHVDLPLNLDQNSHNHFYMTLKAARAAAVARANALPILPNPGVGGRGASGLGRL
ncbi:GIY-YIG nuclease family protein [Lolliginicoccus levis]|uniref:GIY-YIG nuclease family protein n=1 Tax=Lolliginicoccus levis TaxID=2919542 RepID=UPI0035A24113